ncbi:MAG: hypothetical protein ACI865_003291, partial [Flavobacteriaceae bacterium]
SSFVNGCEMRLSRANSFCRLISAFLLGVFINYLISQANIWMSFNLMVYSGFLILNCE